MNLEELLYLINNKQLNSKTNNIIITNVNAGDRNIILKSVNDKSPIINYKDIHENNFNCSYALNIFLDLEDIEIFNIFNYSLEKINIDEKIKFENLRDLLKFINILRKNKKCIQFIVYNINKLCINDLKLFNTVLSYANYYYNLIILLKENNLLSYETIRDRYLDFREDFYKTKLVRF